MSRASTISHEDGGIGSGSSDPSAPDPLLNLPSVVGPAAAAVAFGVLNRVLYKMALVPLKNYPFFLAQLTTMGYVTVYSAILLTRIRLGIVTKDMLAVPKRPFLIMGLCEACGLASGMAAAAKIPGALIPVLSQSFLAWQLLMSSLLLGRRYSQQQLLGCFLVVIGVIAVVSTSGAPARSAAAAATSSLSFASLAWPIVFVISAAFPAVSSIVKESVFRDYAANRASHADKSTADPPRSLDLFVVNTFGSVCQAMFVLLILPLVSWLGYRIPVSDLPAYFLEGSACLLNADQSIAGCEGAPLLPFVYVACNLFFNVSVLSLLKRSSAVVTSLVITLQVPLTIAVFTLPLPFLGAPAPLGRGFLLGAALLLAGLLTYNSAPNSKQYLAAATVSGANQAKKQD